MSVSNEDFNQRTLKLRTIVILIVEFRKYVNMQLNKSIYCKMT